MRQCRRAPDTALEAPEGDNLDIWRQAAVVVGDRSGLVGEGISLSVCTDQRLGEQDLFFALLQIVRGFEQRQGLLR